MENHGPFGLFARFHGEVRSKIRRKADLANVRLTPRACPRDIFQHQRALHLCSRARLTHGLKQLGRLKVKESEPHPRCFTMIGATDYSQLGDLREEFGLTDFSTAGNDWIGEVFPHHCQKATDDLILLALEYDRPPNMDHRIPTAGKPVDVSHVVEFDGNDWFARERKALGNVTLEGRVVSQKACADNFLARTTGGIGVCFGWDLSRARCWPEMSWHPVDAPALELVRH